MKNLTQIFSAALAIVVLCGCSQKASTPAATSASADLLLLNGKIYTQNADQPWAQAMAVRDGKIAAVGSSEQLASWKGDSTQVIELDNKMLMPGINDAHLHPAWGGVKDLYRCNFPFSASPQLVADTIADCVANQDDAVWILGGQWTSDFFVNNKLESPRKFLDRVSGDKAVLLDDDSGHNAWANSKALELIGINKDTVAPPGVTIVRDPVTGEPNGVLMEAFNMTKKVVPDWSLAQYQQGAQYSVDKANSFGVTGMKDASASPIEVEAFYQLDQQQGLTVHLASCLLLEGDDLNNIDVDKLLAMRDQFKSAHVDTRFVKIFLDGVPTASRTAAMLAPYVHEDDGKDNFGDLHVKAELLAERVALLDKLGFTVKIHAAGDRSVRVALDAIEYARQQNGNSGLRHELAHAGYIDDEDIPRFVKLNAVADLSPYIWFPSPIIDSVLGAVGERGEHYWPTKSLIENNVMLLAGSDWPSAVPDMNPWTGLEAIVSRKDPMATVDGSFWQEQGISLSQAIKLFTIDGARALRLEDKTGSLEVGKSADFIVLNQNLFDVPVENITDTEVLMTYFEGQLVYQPE
jgi:predicted amidohydrolase YtcJ